MVIDLLGRLHILILHLPIGILLLYVLLEWLNQWRILKIDSKLCSAVLFIGSCSALLASITGYVLSLNGVYPEDLINNHMWSGIILTAFSFILWYYYYSIQGKVKWVALIIALGVAFTGHLGGSLTHGENFLFTPSNSEEKETNIVFNISNAEEVDIYEDLIQPVFDARCVSCHGSKKKKGKLRLDRLEFLIQGGKSGKNLISNRANNSELLRRMDLPLSDEKHMPPAHKPQITINQKSIIKWWVYNGGKHNSLLTNFESTDSVNMLIKSLINESDEKGEMRAKIKPGFLPNTNLGKADKSLLNELASLNVVTLNAGVDSKLLDLNFLNVSELKKRHWEILEDIAPHITRLKLSGLNVRDKDLAKINLMINLVSLYLDNTQISNEGLIKLQDLQQLRYLNLNNTNVDDKGVQGLSNLQNLKSLYVFQTNVSLDELNNDANVIIGNYDVPTFPNDTIRISQY